MRECIPDDGLLEPDFSVPFVLLLTFPLHLLEPHPMDSWWSHHHVHIGVTSRNGKTVRQELSGWPLVAHNGPFPRIILLCPVEAYPSLTSGPGR